MARRYEKGVLVGEPDPPKELPEIAAWVRSEWEGARQRRDKEAHTSAIALGDRAYLSGREGVLSQLLGMLEGMGY